MGDANHKYPIGSKWKLNEKGRAHNRNILTGYWPEDFIFEIISYDYASRPLFRNKSDGDVNWGAAPEHYLTRIDLNTLQGFIFGLEEEIRKGS